MVSFARWWEVRDRQQAESRMIVFDKTEFGQNESGLRFERQASMMDMFATVGYADLQKKLNWELPSHGFAWSDCGDLLSNGCTNLESHPGHKVFVRLGKKACHRRECPVCFESWASKEGESALIRMASFVSGRDSVQDSIFRLKHENRKRPSSVFHKALVSELEMYCRQSRRKIIHVVLSPPQDLAMEKHHDYEKVRRQAYIIAKASGLYAGSLIFHPYRLKCASCGSTIPDYLKMCPECQSNRFEWFWSPHFHVLGLGWIVDTKEGYSRHGWVVKNLKVRDSVFWTFQYLLSHCGISKGVHSATWFGRLAYNKFGHIPQIGVLVAICPYCERVLRPLEWIGGEDTGPPGLDESDVSRNEFLDDPLKWRTI